MTDQFFKKYYRILSVIPGIGTFCAISKMVWYGFHRDVEESLNGALDVVIGVLLDVVFPGKTLVKMTILVATEVVSDGIEYLESKMVKDPKETLHNRLERKITSLQQSPRKNIVDDDRDKIDFNNEHCVFIDNEVATQDEIANRLRFIFQLKILKGSSYYGHISYSPYIENRMVTMTFPNGIYYKQRVSLFLNFDKDGSNTKYNYIKTVNGVLGLNRETGKYSFGKDQDYYYYDFLVIPLKDATGQIILPYGKINLYMRDFEGKIVTESKLRINISDNFYYIKDSKNNYFAPEKNDFYSKLIFKSIDESNKSDALFYFFHDRICHWKTFLIMSADILIVGESRKIYSNLYLENIEYEKRMATMQKWSYKYLIKYRIILNEIRSQTLYKIYNLYRPEITLKSNHTNENKFTFEKPNFIFD
ncbi:2778_t:CDS:1 [Dentiscutata heterogama]|uniref:2778_t:CDS:1 n=1 Tax=Dentiscutata heterogama TaxID=1316150 RepID=A0ACA9LA92_9GLOM|nr:2778_t:CDS:1 [Dentiscutata heterogama]